jgi:peptidyl-prolyl cis-trans isomerase SurA
MKLKPLFAALFTFIFSYSFSQTLFTYGNKAVDAKEFLRTYNKNNPDKPVNKATAINDYLEQYIRSKLKTAEAYERRYDTIPGIKMEIANLRGQIADNYMTDPELMKRMQKEAFERSQKDVHFTHIFISFTNPSMLTDTIAANRKKEQVLRRLKKGEDFMTVAEQLSDDPSAKTNKGDGGYITAFTLPYEFENAIYNTAAGKYSAVVISKAGYHIFKKLDERKAAGKIKAQQILFAIPPGSDEAAKKRIAEKADSVYNLLVKGDGFGRLAGLFSNDYISASNNGTMPDIGVGQYEAAFENQLWLLKKDGDISKPFQTAHGWHIVKRVSLKPIITNAINKDFQQEIEQKIVADGRWKASKDFIYNAVNEKPGYKKLLVNDNALWALSDSLLDKKTMTAIGKTIGINTPLFSIGNSSYTGLAWINYAQSYRFRSDGSGVKPYNQLWDEWVKNAVYNYYRDNLEDFNAEFRSQMNEFKDGNLFFEIMQQEIWNKAQADTIVLKNMYTANMKKYMWDKSADAIIFFCSDTTTLKSLHKQVKANPTGWRQIAESFSDKVLADSSRYDWLQLPGLGKAAAKNGLVTDYVINSNDFTGSFSYIAKSNEQPLQKTYNEALGLVINDYQAILEKQLDDKLMKKFPVVVDKKVLAGISK